MAIARRGKRAKQAVTKQAAPAQADNVGIPRSILPGDPRFLLTVPKPRDPETLVASQEKFVIRLPAGMRDRIKASAERNKRSMNTELVYALEALYPPEPDIYDVLDAVHGAIDTALSADGMPYRQVLIQALDKLSERIASGLEFDQYRNPYIDPLHDRQADFRGRFSRWARAQEFGVELTDLKREIERGLFRNARGDTTRLAIELFRKGQPESALRLFRLHEVKFADPSAAHEAIEQHLMRHYEENWGDFDETPPWEDERDW